jgi:hypothetical protein
MYHGGHLISTAFFCTWKAGVEFVDCPFLFGGKCSVFLIYIGVWIKREVIGVMGWWVVSSILEDDGELEEKGWMDGQIA